MQDQNSTHQPMVALLIWWMLALMCFALLAVSISSGDLHVSLDTGLYLEAALFLTDGGKPYIDFVDINPPLAMYLHIPATALAGALHINTVNAFWLYLVALTLIGANLSIAFSRETPLEKNTIGLLAIALVPFLLLYNLGPPSELGQRAHLLAIFIGPYLLLRLGRASGAHYSAWLSAPAGVAMGTLVSLKPQYYGLLILLPELFMAGRYREKTFLLQPEIAGLVIAPLAYLLLFAGPGAASFSIFTEVYLPLILDSYSVYEADHTELVKRAAQYLTNDILITIAACAFTYSIGRRYLIDLATMAGLTCVAGVISFLLQAKGWKYHSIPVEFSAIFAVSVAVAAAAEKWRTRAPLCDTKLVLPLLIVLASPLVFAKLQESREVAQANLSTPLAKAIIEQSEPGDRILFLGFSVWEPYPLLQQIRRRQGSRYAFSFMLPMLYDDAAKVATPRHKAGFKREALESEYQQSLREDVETYKPALMIVNTMPQCDKCPQGLSMHDYLFGQPKLFSFLTEYEAIEVSPGYTVYRRAGSIGTT